MTHTDKGEKIKITDHRRTQSIAEGFNAINIKRPKTAVIEGSAEWSEQENESSQRNFIDAADEVPFYFKEDSLSSNDFNEYNNTDDGSEDFQVLYPSAYQVASFSSSEQISQTSYEKASNSYSPVKSSLSGTNENKSCKAKTSNTTITTNVETHQLNTLEKNSNTSQTISSSPKPLSVTQNSLAETKEQKSTADDSENIFSDYKNMRPFSPVPDFEVKLKNNMLQNISDESSSKSALSESEDSTIIIRNTLLVLLKITQARTVLSKLYYIR